MKTIHEFVRDHGIKMSCKRASSNPHIQGSANMDHWRCTLSRGGKRMSVTFSMGSGHGGKQPSAEEVLSTLAFYASSIDGYSFKEWALNLEYDPDSRSALKTYNAFKKQAQSLKNFLGDAYDEFFQTEDQFFQTEDL